MEKYIQNRNSSTKKESLISSTMYYMDTEYFDTIRVHYLLTNLKATLMKEHSWQNPSLKGQQSWVDRRDYTLYYAYNVIK